MPPAAANSHPLVSSDPRSLTACHGPSKTGFGWDQGVAKNLSTSVQPSAPLRAAQGFTVGLLEGGLLRPQPRPVLM